MELAARLREYREELDGDFVAAIEAQKFLGMMRAEHPDELEAWMRTHAVQFVTVLLAREERRDRAATLASKLDAGFAGGDREVLSLFRTPFVIDAENTRRPLGQMVAADLLYVADEYERDGRHSLAMAAFMKALAKRVRGAAVEEVMDEEKCATLLRSFLPVPLSDAA